ncbi:MAG: hypothetical protein ACKO2V_13005 [Snowella sp.]
MKKNIWQWQIWNNLPYLTCSLLEGWQHGFFTQDFYPRLPEELVTVLDSNATVYRVKQVHGDRVLTPTVIHHVMSQRESEDVLSPADAVLSDQPQQAVWVASAVPHTRKRRRAALARPRGESATTGGVPRGHLATASDWEATRKPRAAAGSVG